MDEGRPHTLRKDDIEVREVLCSETGKPMPKIPLWMADIKVRFISDEARKQGGTISFEDRVVLEREEEDNTYRDADTYEIPADDDETDDDDEAEDDDL